MNVSNIKTHIKDKTFDNFYIFTGDEWKVQQIYIQQIVSKSNLNYKYVQRISDVWKNITNTGFLSKSYCYVVRDDVDIQQDEKLQEQLIKEVLHDNIIILILTNIDKRTKFYKRYKDSIVEFESLKPEILAKYIKNEINLSASNVNKLMELCNYNYGNCLMEVDKIKRYIWQERLDEIEDHYFEDRVFEKFVADGTIYSPPKDAIFDFVDCILNADCVGSFELYDECIRCGEAIMVMLSVLYNNAKAVLQVQSCQSKDIEKVTGLTKWQISNAKKHLNIFSNGELVYIMRMCQECESDIKKGLIDEQYAMKFILANIDW